VSEIRFTPERLSSFHATVEKYEMRNSALLPTLYLAQEQWGYLSAPVMDYVAKLLDIPPRDVYEAVSFYILFRRKDMGKWCLQVCNNITCNMMGSEKLIGIVREELGIGPVEVTENKIFSLMLVQCLGSCGTAPVVEVNDTYVENLTPESFRELIRGLRSGNTKLTLPEVSV